MFIQFKYFNKESLITSEFKICNNCSTTSSPNSKTSFRYGLCSINKACETERCSRKDNNRRFKFGLN